LRERGPVALGRLLAASLLLFCASANAQSTTAAPASAPSPPPGQRLETITVEAARHREVVERQVRSFVTQIAIKPYDSSLARWQTVVPICPLVAGLPREDGEFILARVSKIAAAAGAPLAPEHCKPNLYIVFSADPDALLKAWNKRDVRMFGDESDQGGAKIRKFLNSNSPIRVWYNAELYSEEGVPLGNTDGCQSAMACRTNLRATATRISFNETRDLTSALIMVDGPRARGINFAQLASYIAMLGLAEIRAEADVADAPSILHLFSRSEADRPSALSAWDEAFLKALYHTEQADRQQLAEIKTAMVKQIAP
jgi:hypothetical protein